VDALAEEADEGRLGAISYDEVPITAINRRFPNGETLSNLLENFKVNT